MTVAAALVLAGCDHATLAQFERTLAAHDSASAALADWCQARGYARPVTIRAELVRDVVMLPLADAARILLHPGPDETVGYRHVRLWCGTTMLSEAWNWYMPTRLPEVANRQLETSDVPFGRVLAPWHFTRQRLETTHGPAADCPPQTVLAHRALLELPQTDAASPIPVSYVIECYRPEALR